MNKIFILSALCLFSVLTNANDLEEKSIQLSNQRGTTYEILNHISDLSGYLFMYDSQDINSNRKVKIPAGTYSLKEAIIFATGDQNINIKVFGNHILLYKKTEEITQSKTFNSQLSILNSIITLEGTVKERDTGEPVANCTISILETGMGIIANKEGKFLLKVPDSLKNTYLHFSHLGYKSQLVPIPLLAENKVDVFLDTHYIPLETVVIRINNPYKLMKDMIDAREKNYYDEPHYITTFYREGLNRKNDFSNLTEGVFQVYKPGYSAQQPDIVKMIKMRNIYNHQENDFVMIKMQAGLNACLTLDIIKILPDFLSFDNENMYNYANTGMAMIDNRLAYVISFEQKPGINWCLYKGEMYIDSDNYALLQVNFQLHPDYISQSAPMLVVKRSKNVTITPQEACYSVTYKNFDGKYFINHIRGDLKFNIRKKKIISESSTFYTWFEMVTCKIDTDNVKRFPIRESQPTRNILSDTKYIYDASFWESFNFITPEEKLSDAFLRINAKIEESRVVD